MVVNLLGILIFGSLIFLGFILVMNPLNVNKRANIWFGLFCFIWASFWLEEIVHLITGQKIYLDSVIILNIIQFSSPVFFYISIRCFANPEYKIGTRGFLFLVLPLIYTTLLIIDPILPVNLNPVLYFFKPLHGLAYIFLSLLQIRKHKRDIQQFASNTSDIDLEWLKVIVWASLFLVVGITTFNVLFFNTPLNLYMNALTYFVILVTAYYALKQKEIFPADVEERADALLIVSEPYSEINQNKVLSDERLVDVKSRLNDLITNEELYLDLELSLGKLAKRLEISSHQLSYVINKGYNQNFYSFVNKFRIEKAKKLLLRKELDKYSIVGIAFESGFNSKTTFNTLFKKITGMTPSEYKKRSSDLSI
jgi:AraC-like DNA-binding protein